MSLSVCGMKNHWIVGISEGRDSENKMSEQTLRIWRH